VAISLDVLVADTAAEVADLLLPEAWAMTQARTTRAFPALEPVAAIRADARIPRQQQYLEQAVAAAIAGTPAQVERRLAELLDRTGAAELVAISSTFDRTTLPARTRRWPRCSAGLSPPTAPAKWEPVSVQPSTSLMRPDEGACLP
jgi:alkanesulfonate monooxygenase SsuD/methylene tetrahydromethanopterin reductase-like flavin-dependent oxidoreductase (luciferase family)